MQPRSTLLVTLVTAVACLAAPGAVAQQVQGGWHTQMAPPGSPVAPVRPTFPPATLEQPSPPLLPNTTVVPLEPKTQLPGLGPGQLQLVATLTDDGQAIEQGLVWRIFRDKPGPDGKPRLLATHREAAPAPRLEPGDYIVNVAFGRAYLTRKITVASERAQQERFVLNAGGLRVLPVLAIGEAANEWTVTFDVFSDDRDEHGQRVKVMSGARPGVIIRLNAGIYGIVSTFGDANAVARADVAVEPGRLTEVSLSHAAAKVTLKLVTREGGDAIADTQWSIATSRGETVKESVGALPSHILAPGTYTVSAKHAGQVYQRTFAVQGGQIVQVEVVVR